MPLQLNISLEELEEARRAYQEKGNGVFKKALKSLFDQYPQLGSLVWTQYTPYFNDGDECVFSVGDIYAYSGGTPEELDSASYGELDESDEERGIVSLSGWGSKEAAELVLGALYGEFLTDINELGSFTSKHEEILYDLYGDHVMVTVSRDGDDVFVQVDEYEHE